MDSTALPRSERRESWARVAAILCGLCAAGFFVFATMELPRQQREAARWVAHTLRVLGAASLLQAQLVTVVSQGRAFIIDRSPQSREKFDAAILRLHGGVDTLTGLTIDNPEQQARLDRLRPLIAARIAAMSGVMEQLAAGNEGALAEAIRRHRGQLIMDQILAETTAIEAGERHLLDLRQTAAERAIQHMTWAMVLCGAVLVVSALVQVVVLRGRAAGRRHLAELSRLNAVLEHRVDTRTAELAASMARQRGYFDNAPIAMVVTRVAEGRFILEDINSAAEAIYGFPADAMIGRPLRDVWPEPVATHAEPYLIACASGRETVQYTVLRESADGQRSLDVQLAPLLDAAGQAREILACIRDMTHQRALERQVAEQAEQQREARRQAELAMAQIERQRELERANAELDGLARQLSGARDAADRANRAKSQFMASMSHELRTPLNGILGYAQLLRLEGSLSVGQAQRIDAMLRSGRHLLELVNNVLDVSQIEAGRMDVRLTEIDGLVVCRACMELLGPAAAEKGLALTLSAVEDLPTVLADAGRLRQVMVNLLGNAVKFTDAGSVTLRAVLRREGDRRPMLRLEVVDTGPGVPAEQRGQLFKLFERLDASAGPLEGTGLGLAISQRLVELMDGRIGHADNPRGGSIFWLELPIAAAAPVGAGTLPAPPAAGQHPHLRALIVDDVAMNRDVAAALLRTDGVASVCVEGGEAAVEAAAADDFDVVLMDVRMPGIDGLEATRRIRAGPGRRARVPIVALTAHAFLDQVQECERAGMDAHVVKPFDHEVLLQTIRRVVAARPPLLMAAGPDLG